MRNKGFGIIEVIWIVTIMSMVAVMMQMFYTRAHVVRKAKDLAELTQFYAKIYGHYLDDMQESTLYAMTDATHCARINPFVANNSDYYNLGEKDLTNPRFAKITGLDDRKIRQCQALGGNYWNDTMTGLNDFKQVPCVAVKRNETTGKLQTLLYWANTPDSTKIPKDIIKASIIYTDGAGVYIESGISKGSPNFSVTSSDPIFHAQASSCSGIIGEGSLVFDMSGYVPSNNRLSKSHKLSREKDWDHDPNTPENKNTAQTNIYMNGNSIILDDNVSLKVTSAGVTSDAGLALPSIMPLESVDSYTPCNAEELGNTKKQKDENLRQYGAMQFGSEVCTYAPVICGVYRQGVNYCYIPTKNNTVRYTDLQHTGKLGQTALCPDLLPVLRSATVWQAKAGSNPTQQLRYTQVGGYNIVRGLKAVADKQTSCATWQFNVLGPRDGYNTCSGSSAKTYTCTAGKSYTNKYCRKNTSFFRPENFTNPCDGKSTIADAYNWKCVQDGSNDAYIETMVCSSKYYVEQL